MAFTLSVQSFSRRPTTDVISRVSTASDGAQVEGGHSRSPALSANGRYVVFKSAAPNLVPNDNNNVLDVFRKDLVTGEVVLVSRSADGTKGDGFSSSQASVPQISADGRYVVFDSAAPDLIATDTNNLTDVFLKDLETKQIVRISTGTNGTQSTGNSYNASFSTDGRYVLFESSAPNLVAADSLLNLDIYRKDLLTGEIIQISTGFGGTQSNGNSQNASFSPSGRYVAFESTATNLVPDDKNAFRDIFIKDLQGGGIIRASTGVNGEALGGHSVTPMFSANGQYVVFASAATNLVAGGTKAGTTNIFRKNLNDNTIVLVSAASDGTQGNGNSEDPQVSADGRYVVFTSAASNLVLGDNNSVADIFRKDLLTGEVVRISVAANGAEAEAGSYSPFMSADGRIVAFASEAPNLIAGDTYPLDDIFQVDTALLPQGPAIAEGRHVRATLDVGAASSVTVAWGDGSSDAVTPVGGSASFSHAYAAMGAKAATVTLVQGAQRWIVPYKIDLAATAMTRDTAKADTQIGGKGRDALKGDAYANILKGGLGNDVLTGGKGKDTFVFDTKPNRKSNLDKIVDFNVKDDTIFLDNKYMPKLGKGTALKPGKLNKGFFTIGDKAKDKNDYLVYNAKKGILYYDADGSGAKAMVEIAILKKGLKMTYKDFFIV